MLNIEIKDEEYELINVKNDILDVTFSTLGASIYSLKIFNHNFLLAPDDINRFFVSKGYYGKTLGPIAGRYNTLDYGSKDKNIILHGGENGLSFKKFNYEIKITKSTFKLIFTYKMDESNHDFIGNHAIYVVEYIIRNSNTIKVIHKIKALEDTYASLSTHFYFCLNEKDIRNTYLRLKAKKVSKLSSDFLIKGFTTNLENLNFNKFKLLKDELKESSPLLEKGQHYKSVTYPITIKDKEYEVDISSTYKDALLTIDQLPNGEICQKEREDKYRAYIIEPEIVPINKKELYLPKRKIRKQIIKYTFKKV